MKLRFFLICVICMGLFLSCSDSSESSFPEKIFTGSVTLETQEEVDAFGENNYTIIDGWFRIGSGFATENSITNVDKLKSIRKMAVLDIGYQSELINLKGLSNLETVGYINIIFCDKLNSLTGLEKLERIEGRPNDGGIHLDGNKSLESLNGFKNLQYVEGDVELSRNGLSSLQGLEKLSAITGHLQITNPSGVDFLQNIDGLSGLTSIGGSLILAGNDNITNLNGLQDLKNIGGVTIFYNDLLSDFCGLREALVNAKNANTEVTYGVDWNLFNPTMEGIVMGTCTD